ncbi:MAG: sulfur carrier protein ThiS [Acidobacteria bacterium]|nr:sulfur carrier protein ThiS [Acidobacteriota bacterium]
MEIVVNGTPRNVAQGTTILTLLEALAITPDRVAVELDRVIIKAPRWPETTLNDGARIEIVHFVGGG